MVEGLRGNGGGRDGCMGDVCEWFLKLLVFSLMPLLPIINVLAALFITFKFGCEKTPPLRDELFDVAQDEEADDEVDDEL